MRRILSLFSTRNLLYVNSKLCSTSNEYIVHSYFYYNSLIEIYKIMIANRGYNRASRIIIKMWIVQWLLTKWLRNILIHLVINIFSLFTFTPNICIISIENSKNYNVKIFSITVQFVRSHVVLLSQCVAGLRIRNITLHISLLL